MNLERRVRPLAPDVLFIYHATNDLTKDTRALAMDQGVYDGHGETDDFLTRWSVAWFLIKKNIQFRMRVRAAARSDGRLSFEPSELSRGFRKRLTELVESCQSVAPVVVLITFSQRTRLEQTVEKRLQASSSSLYYMPYMTPDGVQTAFDEYNRVIREVGQATGAVLVIGEHKIPADATHFADSVHLTDAGCRWMAAHVVEQIVDGEALRALLQ